MWLLLRFIDSTQGYHIWGNACPKSQADLRLLVLRHRRCRRLLLDGKGCLGPDDKFDLVIKEAEVLDPSQSLRAKRDIGIRYGLIEALADDILTDKANRVLNATGKAAIPG